MKRVSTLLAVAAAATLFTFAAADPICIVGAGPAGLTIANRLQAKGLETVVFDKNPKAGGKCQAFYDDKGLFHPLGALLFSNETYRETLPIVKASGLPSFPFEYTSKPWLFDWRTGFVEQAAAAVSELTKVPLFKQEIDSYIHFWNTEFAPKISIGYKNGVEGYTMSTFQWLQEHNYPLLLLLFVQGMVPYGYGDVTEVPILYMLQYFTPDILLFFAGQHTGYIIDFQEVFVRYARDHVNGLIHLSTEITKIDRTGDHPVITYSVPNGIPTTQNCDRLVLAFPPVMHALEAAKLDISETERKVFTPVGITKYWSSAIQVATPYGFSFSGFFRPTFLCLINRILKLGIAAVNFADFIPSLPEAAGEPTAMIRLFNQSNIATTWSWGKYRGNQTYSEAKTLLREVISKINKDPANATAPPIPIVDSDIKAFRGWDYFPRFDKAQLDAGYYDMFNQLQGQQKTYYASGLNGFETVEFAIRAGLDVVESYF